MKKLFSIFVPALILFLLPSNIIAHSGRTDSSGGHNCSAKSISKGLCTGYHYHNGGYSAPAYIAPVATLKPSTPKPTLKPTQAPTSTPTIEAEVLGAFATTEATASPIVTQTPSPTIEPLVEGSTTKKSGFVDLGLIGLAIFGYIKYRQNKKLQLDIKL